MTPFATSATSVVALTMLNNGLIWHGKMQSIVSFKSECFRPWEHFNFNEKNFWWSQVKVLEALTAPQRKLSGSSNLIQVVCLEQGEQNQAEVRSRRCRATSRRLMDETFWT